MPRQKRAREVRPCIVTGLPVTDPPNGRPREYASLRAKRVFQLIRWLEAELSQPDFRVTPDANKRLRADIWGVACALNGHVVTEDEAARMFEAARLALEHPGDAPPCAQNVTARPAPTATRRSSTS